MSTNLINLSKIALALGAIAFAVTLSSCTIDKGELGSAKNPVKLFFIPSVDVKVIEAASAEFEKYLEEQTGYQFETKIPHSFIAVVEAFGSKQADVASINTFGYMLAHDKYQAEARLTVLRYGMSTYQAQFVTKTDGPIKKLEDLNGKKVAFVDPSSASGFLLPKKILNDRNVKPSEEVFAMKHDSVVSMVYQGQVDAGATFYSPPHEGAIQDARRLVKTQYPDVEAKVKILELTDFLPNDPIIFRKEVPEEMKVKITKAFVDYLQTENGKANFEKVYGVNGVKAATDADYAAVRDVLKSLGKNAEELMKK